MNLRRLFSLTLASGLLLSGAARSQEDSTIILATTTSTYDSGLLDSLVPLFEQARKIRVKIIAVGSGAALAMAARGDADAVLVHAPARELEYVRSGDLIEGRLVMHNDFVLAGPAKDPAGVLSCRDVACAMRAIARNGAFVSRGDRSGTHEMELALWRKAGITADSVSTRVETGQGMGATLDVAGQRNAYTLTDRGTLLAHPAGRSLRVVFEGDPQLLNVYHVYLVNPGRHGRVNATAARAFVAFMASDPAQRAIGEFGRSRFGRPLFVPDASRDSTRLVEVPGP
jgi:tungstate transport system substrate-binding protein